MNYIFITIMLASVSYIPMFYDIPVASQTEHNFEWQSLEELQSFLANDNSDTFIILHVNSDGVANLNGCCEDRAFQLRERAELFGKRLETEVLTKNECIIFRQYLNGDPYSMKPNERHMLCKAFIGNDIYLVEPANDNVWWFSILD